MLEPISEIAPANYETMHNRSNNRIVPTDEDYFYDPFGSDDEQSRDNCCSTLGERLGNMFTCCYVRLFGSCFGVRQANVFDEWE